MKYWRVPLDIDTVQIPHGVVHIDIDLCKGCAFCEEYCPRDVLAMSDAFNRKGYHYPEVVKSGECVNCGLCEAICPEFAIFCTEGEPGPAAAWAVQPGEEAP
ncbi:MAG: 4Fe-4S dicluster domain-containing protein [Candidatus Marinimicrobia bacterium]|nr:4Fe-4S dicluster domain-containing protein [Candidatus Neomarinimicrobiota bacterium]